MKYSLAAVPRASLGLLGGGRLVTLGRSPLKLRTCIIRRRGRKCILIGSVRQGHNGMHTITLCGPSSAVYDFAIPVGVLRLKKGIGTHSLIGRRSLPRVGKNILGQRLPPRDILVLHVRSRGELRTAICRTR